MLCRASPPENEQALMQVWPEGLKPLKAETCHINFGVVWEATLGFLTSVATEYSSAVPGAVGP